MGLERFPTEPALIKLGRLAVGLFFASSLWHVRRSLARGAGLCSTAESFASFGFGSVRIFFSASFGDVPVEVRLGATQLPDSPGLPRPPTHLLDCRLLTNLAGMGRILMRRIPTNAS